MNAKKKQAVYQPPSDSFKWVVAAVVALLIATPTTFYLEYVRGELFSLTTISFTLATVASFMYAMSFASSSFSYYIGWPNMRDGYQKQIGVFAFWASLAYAITLLFLYPDTYYYGFWDNLWTANVSLGLMAMFIFGLMTVINSKPVAKYFSWDTIKAFLGLGFLGYALLVLRAAIVEGDLWVYWLTTFDGEVPGRLLLSVVAIGVLVLRLSIPIHIKIFGKK